MTDTNEALQALNDEATDEAIASIQAALGHGLNDSERSWLRHAVAVGVLKGIEYSRKVMAEAPNVRN